MAVTAIAVDCSISRICGMGPGTWNTGPEAWRDVGSSQTREYGRQRRLISVAAVEWRLQKILVWFWTIFCNYFLPLKFLATGIRRQTRQNLLWPTTTWLNCTTKRPSTLARLISSRIFGTHNHSSNHCCPTRRSGRKYGKIVSHITLH